MHPKETYNGAIPSGNSVMAYNLVQLHFFTGEQCFGELAKQQLTFMSAEAASYPASHAMFLLAWSDSYQ